MNYSFTTRFLDGAKEYIQGTATADQASIAASIVTMQSGDLQSVHTKQLKGQIRELIVGYHRLTYFHFSGTLYFVNGFRKKTKKTPKSEIEYAENIYKLLKDAT